MSRVTELRLDCAKTINLGNFNSLRVEAGLTIELQPEDSIEAVKADAQPLLRALFEDTYRAQLKTEIKSRDEP